MTISLGYWHFSFVFWHGISESESSFNQKHHNWQRRNSDLQRNNHCL